MQKICAARCHQRNKYHVSQRDASEWAPFYPHVTEKNVTQKLRNPLLSAFVWRGVYEAERRKLHFGKCVNDQYVPTPNIRRALATRAASVAAPRNGTCVRPEIRSIMAQNPRRAFGAVG